MSSSSDLVIFDAFNTLIVPRPGCEGTFAAALESRGLRVTQRLLAWLQRASEGLDHHAWSCSRVTYVAWARETLALITRRGAIPGLDRYARITPALEQLHQAPMMARPGARSCLEALKAAGFMIAVCSNWGWDLEADLGPTGLVRSVDYLVTSARAGYRKPNPGIYRTTLDLAGSSTENAVFVGDGLRTDVAGPAAIGIRSVLLSASPPRGFQGERAQSLTAVSQLLTSEGQSGRRNTTRSRPGPL